ncbi:hypothetical protein R1flu_005646 [Riccia fluitans]|uniref:CCHC-type domain-containing protein n=1 Tax=Riccia fluitans TaxID=41844 RepID=A0ABD1YWR2_9MARC
MVEWKEFFSLSVSDHLSEALLCAIPFYSHSQLRCWREDLEESFEETPVPSPPLVLVRNALIVEIEWRDELQAAIGLWEEVEFPVVEDWQRPTYPYNRRFAWLLRDSFALSRREDVCLHKSCLVREKEGIDRRRQRKQSLRSNMMAQSSRLRYPVFKGKEGDDPDLFLQEFDLTADANRENEDADKLRLFPALLKNSSSSSEESSSSSNDSDEEERSHRRRRSEKDKKKNKKSTHSRDSSSDDPSSNESEDETRRHQKKERHHKKPDKKDPIDQLVKEMAELKVRLAAPKEKRKDAMTLRHDLWCSLCGNQGHTKEDCHFLGLTNQPQPTLIG